MRPLFIALGLLFVALPSLVLASAPTRGAQAAAPSIPLYEVQYLGTLPGASNSIAYGVNDLGDVVGYSGYPEQAFVWRESTGMVRLGPIPGYTRCHARDINTLGDVAGTCGWDLSDEPSRATRWSADGTPQNLGTLGGPFSEGHGINDLGNVVGGSRVDAAPLTYHAFIYTDEAGLIDLTPDEDGTVRGYAINDVGPIGEATGSSTQAFRWRNGTLEWLPVVPGFGFTSATSINDNSQIAGNTSSASGNSEKVARWTDGIGWEILGGVGEDNQGWGINNGGTVVGTGRPFAGAERAFIYTDETGIQDLNNYLATPNWFISNAFDINEDGIIVGTGSDNTGLAGAVRLVPVTGLPCTSQCARAANLALQAVARNNTVYARGTAQIQDETGAPLPAATVAATWTRPDGTTQQVTARSTRSGTVLFNTSGIRGTYTLTITDISRAGYTFDPLNSDLSASITR